MDGRVIDVLNLGAGVQSSTIALMMKHGMLSIPECAIFADTGWEPPGVYKHLEWLISEVPFPVYIVSKGNIRKDALESQVRGVAAEGKRWASMPYYVDTGGEKEGTIRRQCTAEYKIAPIEKYVRREILKLKPKQRIPQNVMVNRIMGISWDEVTRVRASKHDRFTNVYPLAGFKCGKTTEDTEDYLPLGKRWTRRMCKEWLHAHYPERYFPRSACIGCPFHDNGEWRHLRDNDPESWADAVDFDKQIRKCGGMRGDVYLHASLKPLDEVDLSTDREKGQTVFGFIDECEGMCGI